MIKKEKILDFKEKMVVEKVRRKKESLISCDY
jgi:hypothetical protein